MWLGEVAVDVPAVKNPDKNDLVCLNLNAYAEIAEANPVIVSLTLEFFEVGKLGKVLGLFNFFDDLFDVVQKVPVFSACA